MPDDYAYDATFNELVDNLVLAVASGKVPSFDYLRDAVDVAQLLSTKATANYDIESDDDLCC